MSDPAPDHDSLAQELRTLREKGLLRLRHLELPALRQAALTVQGAGGPTEVEALLRAAVRQLGEDETGLAAAYLYGLVQGTIGRRPTDLRERAAREYGLSPETFRKGPERLLISRIADEILRLPPGSGPAGGPPGSGPPVARPVDRSTAPGIARDLERAAEEAGEFDATRYGPHRLRLGAREVDVVVDVGPVEYLRDVDVVVSSENVYLEPARMYTATLSGALRRAAAERDGDGSVTRDVVRDELAAWVTRHGSIGQPFEPGIVVPTGSGALVAQGIRRLYHATAAEPQIGTHEYGVSGEVIARSVRSVLTTWERERGGFEPPLRTVSFPLFGAGYGRMAPGASFVHLWRPLRAGLQRSGPSEVHVTVLNNREAVAVLEVLCGEEEVS